MLEKLRRTELLTLIGGTIFAMIQSNKTLPALPSELDETIDAVVGVVTEVAANPAVNPTVVLICATALGCCYIIACGLRHIGEGAADRVTEDDTPIA